MTPEQWLRVKSLFLDACELPEEQQQEFLLGACPGEPEILGQVKLMLAAQPDSSHGLDPPTPDEIAESLDLSPSLIGVCLGDFEIKEEVGRGAMGIVFRASQKHVDREVAVKVLPPVLATSRLRLKRFRREAQSLAKLRHPGIAALLAFGEQDGVVYYAMEFVDGHSLEEFIRRAAKARTPPGDLAAIAGDTRRSAEVVTAVLESLQHAHERGILHRDVKPANVLVDVDGRPRLVDFGLAKDFESSNLTLSNESPGTLRYMSPEQATTAHHNLDRRADVYSAGAVLYELLALKPPFSDASQGELFEKVVHENPRSIRAINPRVPPELETICQLALRKSRDDRYPSARAFADDLRRFLAGRNILARPPRLRDRARGAIVRRRTLVRAVPAALLLSLVGGIGTQRVISYASSRRARPKLRLSLEGQGGPARVRALPLADRVGRWGPPVEEASFEGGELQLSLPPGEYRIQVVRQDGAFAELRRRLRLHTEYPEPVRCAAIADVSQGMRKVPAGSIDVWLAAFDPETREGKVFEETLTYGDFLVDAACVTNRQFRQFALEGGVEPGRRKPWMEPPSMSGWEVLPATGMTWKESRDCAEWMGKRLPTIVEWAAAAIGPDRSWLSADVIRPETTPFVLGRPILALGSTADPNHSPDSTGAYELYVEPAAPPGAEGLGPHRLHHGFGNVMQWLETPALELRGGEIAWHDSQRLLAGGCWHTPVQVMFGEPFALPMWSGDASPERGFRCAKSVRP